MVRQLDPTPSGLPLQMYFFTRTTAWEEYESVQSDIFDHIYAVIGRFGLSIFQTPGRHRHKRASSIKRVFFDISSVKVETPFAALKYRYYLCNMKMRELRHFIVLMVLHSWAWRPRWPPLFGSVTDTAGESLPQASVRVLAARDSSLVKAAVTNNNGRFTISGIKQGKYLIEASYAGFEAQTRPVTVGEKDIRLSLLLFPKVR